MATKSADLMSQVFTLRQIASSPSTTIVAPKNGAKKKTVFYGDNQFNILVVRVNAANQLVNSQPCCMCIHMMKQLGIYRVYYSNDQGEICFRKVNQIQDENAHISRGFLLMISQSSKTIKVAKLPLTKKQKTEIISRKPFKIPP
jgi:hypothetical protein